MTPTRARHRAFHVPRRDMANRKTAVVRQIPNVGKQLRSQAHAQICKCRGVAADVVLDNLRAHHAPEVRSLVEGARARLLFLPPYSPDFSPIEPCWAFLKTWLRALKERVPARLKAAIVRGLRRVTTQHLTSWFIHCGYHFK